MSLFGRSFVRASRVINPTVVVPSRGMAHYVGSWPGPNPLKEIAYGTVLGLVLAGVWKNWQMNDKAERVASLKVADDFLKQQHQQKAKQINEEERKQKLEEGRQQSRAKLEQQ